MMNGYPETIDSVQTELGEYRGWKIVIGTARGEDEDCMSVNAHGTSYCIALRSTEVPRGEVFILPDRNELDSALSTIKNNIDKYERKLEPQSIVNDIRTTITGWTR
jgi:hypothetical protein